MNRQEVAEKIRSDVELQIALDDRIHNQHSNMASQINNAGIEAQLKWLTENIGMNENDIYDWLVDEKGAM